jgi:monoamine oxidase
MGSLDCSKSGGRRAEIVLAGGPVSLSKPVAHAKVGAEGVTIKTQDNDTFEADFVVLAILLHPIQVSS